MGVALPLLTMDAGSWFCSFIKCIFLKVDVGSGKGGGASSREGRCLTVCVCGFIQDLVKTPAFISMGS